MKNNHDDFDNVIELVLKLDEKQVRMLEDEVELEMQQRKIPIIEDPEDGIELDEETNIFLDEFYESQKKEQPEYYAAFELLPKLDEEQLRILKKVLHKRRSEYDRD